MSGAVAAALLLVACWLLALPRRTLLVTPPAGADPGVIPGASPRSGASGTRVGRRCPTSDPHDIPLFVHQLTGLLQAGRTPSQLWGDVLAVHPSHLDTGFATAARPVLQSAHQAAVLGLSVPDVLREAAGCAKDRALPKLWEDLAACLEISDRSGAPLATVLARYAVQRESQLDSDAARDTALAGPRATVRLLSWLPLFGLAVGYLIGIDPVAILLGSAPGMAALCAGTVLMVAGRIWSSRLVAHAEGHSS